MKKTAARIDYNVLANSVAAAHMSRRAALQVELAVGLVHFSQENNGADTAGKASLKSVYNSAGYMCMAKADRDYKTVNRRINGVAQLFDKLGSRTVNAWVNACVGDTEAILAYVVTELQAYSLDTMDDVADFCGANSNRARAARQPKSGPVGVIKPEAAEAGEGEGEGAATAAPQAIDLAMLQATLLDQFNDDQLNEFMAGLMDAMSARVQKAA